MKEELLKRLDALAERLGVATEHLWAVLVKQGQVEGWMALICLVLWLAVPGTSLILLLRYLIKRAKKDKDLWDLVFLAAAIGGSILLVGGYAMAQDVLYLFNPEMYALQYVRGLL